MRTIPLLFIAILLAGCQSSEQSTRQTSNESGQTESTGSELGDKPVARDTGDMHTDKFIESLVDFDITATSGGIDPNNQILDVVPAGESHLRADVFKKLKLDETKLSNFRTSGMNMVDFLTWQVSPLYDITCMSANNDPHNDGLKMTDPHRKVYGMRLSLTDQ